MDHLKHNPSSLFFFTTTSQVPGPLQIYGNKNNCEGRKKELYIPTNLYHSSYIIIASRKQVSFWEFKDNQTSQKFIWTLVQNHAKSSLHLLNLKVLLSLLQVMTCIFIVPKNLNLEWSSSAFDHLEGTDITYFQRVISHKLCPTWGELYIAFSLNVLDRPSSSIWNWKDCIDVIPFEVRLDKTQWYGLHG